MVKQFARAAALAAALFLTYVPEGQAQEQLNLSFLNEGKPPAQPVTVSTVQDGEKTALAMTNSTGVATIDFDSLDLEDGTPVDVIVINCDGEVGVVLLPPGEVSEECDRARQDPNCNCARIGTVYWGETGAATVHIDGNGATLQTESGADAGSTGGGTGIRIGGGATWSTFPQLENTANDQTGVTGSEVDDSSIGPYLSFEYTPSWGIPLGFGVRGDYKQVSVSQTFSGAGLPTASTTDLKVWSAGLYAFYGLPLGSRATLIPELGFLNAWNKGNITSEYASGTVTESRSQSGLRGTLGLSLEYSFSHVVDVRAGYRFTNGDSDDADQNHEAAVGLGLSLGGGQ